MARRTRIELMALILEGAVEGAGKTALMHRASMDTRGINRTLLSLVALNLLERDVDDGGRVVYRTTERGLLFLRHYRRLERLLQRGGE